MAGRGELRWARRVAQHKIRQLYQLDAKGVVDEDLIDDVGYALLARCEAIRTVTRAHAGRAACPLCKTMMEHEWHKDELMTCVTCGWQVTWGEYLKSYQGKQLHGGSGYGTFRAFIGEWPEARTPRDKMLAIDRLIHGCHGAERWGMSRPTGVNVIEGSAHDVAALLEDLAYGDGSTQGLVETRERFRDLAQRTGWDAAGRGRRKATASAAGEAQLASSERLTDN
jgi:hypothetical protein